MASVRIPLMNELSQTSASLDPSQAPPLAPRPPETETVPAAPPVTAPLTPPAAGVGEPTPGEAPAPPAATVSAIESAVAAVSAAEALSLGLTPAQRTAIEKLTTGHT